MAISKKPRKKKNPQQEVARRQKRISNTIKDTYQNLYFVGTSWKPPYAVNANKLALTTKKDELRIARKVLLENLCMLKTAWPLWMGLFFDNGEGGMDVLTGDSIFMDQDLVSFGGQFDVRAEALIDKIIADSGDESTTRDNLIGYGYFFSHADVYDIDTCDERFVQLFLRQIDKDQKKVDENWKPVSVTTDLLIESIVTRGGNAVNTPAGENQYITVEETL